MKRSTILWLTIFYISISTPALLFARLKVIKLKHSQPEEIISILNQLYQRKVNTSSVPSLNAVVINADETETLNEIEQLIAQLDKKPVTLKFSVKMNSEAENTSTTLTSNNGLEHQKSNSTQNNLHTLIALENHKASLTRDLIKIYRYPLWYGEATEVVTISRGLKISGRLSGQNQVQVDIWYSSTGQHGSDVLLTSIQAPLGKWFSLAGQNATSRNPRIKIDQSHGLNIKDTDAFIHRRYLVKVDRVN